MPTEPIICNTSPLIGLSGINLLSVLRDLYTEVWIPREVENEFLAIDETIHRNILNNAPWIKTVDLTDSQKAEVYVGIDVGEAEVLALASEHEACLVLIDEKKARRMAQDIGLNVKGTVGILLEAKNKGLIDAIKPLVIEMRNNGIRLSESLIEFTLKVADET